MTNSSLGNGPLISIIIATLNDGDLLQTTIDSVLLQTYSRVELIIVDGGSTDNTSFVVQHNASSIALFISERDSGIYDAFNKGIAHSSGDWVSFIGAGDEFQERALEVLIASVRSFEIDNSVAPDFVHGLTEVSYANGSTAVVGEKFSWNRFRKFMNISHSGSLMNREFFKKFGYFDVSYKIAGDYELLLRAGSKLKASFVNQIVTIEDGNGVSNVSQNVYHECFRAKISHGSEAKFSALIFLCYCLLSFKIKKFSEVFATDR